MDIKIKRRGLIVKRIEAKVGIDEVLIKEDMINPDSARIILYFKGGKDSGIIAFSKKELDMLAGSVRTGLVKKPKKIR